MIVDLVFQPFLTDLIETMELVEVNRVSVRHDHAVKNDGHSALLTETGRTNFLGFSEHDRAVGDKHMLAVV